LQAVALARTRVHLPLAMLRRYQVWSCSSSTPGARSVQAENREQAIALARRFHPTGPLVAIDAELMELAHPIAGEGGHHPGQQAEHRGTKGEEGQ
jgi:hypothetical protein